MGQEGGASVPGEFQTVRLSSGGTKVRHQGHNQLSAPVEMSERAAGARGRELAAALTDAGSDTAMSHWCPCCSPIEPAPGGQKPRKQPRPRQSAQFQPDIYYTRTIDEEFFTNSRPRLWEMTS